MEQLWVKAYCCDVALRFCVGIVIRQRVIELCNNHRWAEWLRVWNATYLLQVFKLVKDYNLSYFIADCRLRWRYTAALLNDQLFCIYFFWCCNVQPLRRLIFNSSLFVARPCPWPLFLLNIAVRCESHFLSMCSNIADLCFKWVFRIDRVRLSPSNRRCYSLICFLASCTELCVF
jgi:hypothetical protein